MKIKLLIEQLAGIDEPRRTNEEQSQWLDMPMEKGHRRIEKRSYSLATAIDWLPQIKDLRT